MCEHTGLTNHIVDMTYRVKLYMFIIDSQMGAGITYLTIFYEVIKWEQRKETQIELFTENRMKDYTKYGNQ